jgi:transposase InsO family protein
VGRGLHLRPDLVRVRVRGVIVDVFAQRIVGWHASTTRSTDPVLTCLRMATWQRQHDRHPVLPGQLTHHHDDGSQYTSLRFTEHLALEQRSKRTERKVNGSA